MTWTLIILILNTVPPRGVEVSGFKDQAECQKEMERFCDRSTVHIWKCKCLPPKEGEA